MKDLPLSELSWVLADYRAAQTDPPARCVSNPGQTEGQMMTQDEIDEYIKDSIATIRILAQRNTNRAQEIALMFEADMAYLVTLGRLGSDEYDELTDQSNLRF